MRNSHKRESYLRTLAGFDGAFSRLGVLFPPLETEVLTALISAKSVQIRGPINTGELEALSGKCTVRDMTNSLLDRLLARAGFLPFLSQIPHNSSIRSVFCFPSSSFQAQKSKCRTVDSTFTVTGHSYFHCHGDTQCNLVTRSGLTGS